METHCLILFKLSEFPSPSKPRQASIHRTWQPTSPKRFKILQNVNVLQKVASESETDRAERLLVNFYFVYLYLIHICLKTTTNFYFFFTQ